MDFGTQVRVTRVLYGLSQEQLATQVGCSNESISKIELGQRQPSDSLRYRLERALNLPATKPILDKLESYVRRV